MDNERLYSRSYGRAHRGLNDMNDPIVTIVCDMAFYGYYVGGRSGKHISSVQNEMLTTMWPEHRYYTLIYDPKIKDYYGAFHDNYLKQIDKETSNKGPWATNLYNIAAAYVDFSQVKITNYDWVDEVFFADIRVSDR